MKSAKPTTYWDYIKVEELLGLQSGLEGDENELTNDEVLFITVHQIFELWFKLMLREMRAARDLFMAPVVAEQQLSGAAASFRRVSTLLQRCADHFTVMETLPTREYLAFRDKLMPASGFQSAQLREVEIIFGLEAKDRIGYGLDFNYLEALRAADGSPSPALKRVERALEDTPTLKTAMEDWLFRTPIDGKGPDDEGAEERLDAFLEDYLAAHSSSVDRTLERALLLADKDHDRAKLTERYSAEKASVAAFFTPDDDAGGARTRRVRAAMLFIETYRELPLLAWPREVLDALVELEQLFVIFRQRHARMVERVIGQRTGTGGSAGVDYLDTTALKYRIFRDLWAIRTLQIPADLAPDLREAGFYGFASA